MLVAPSCLWVTAASARAALVPPMPPSPTPSIPIALRPVRPPKYLSRGECRERGQKRSRIDLGQPVWGLIFEIPRGLARPVLTGLVSRSLLITPNRL